MERKIEELKKKYKENMDIQADIVRRHVEKEGAKECSYLSEHRAQEHYYRGAWNAINEIDIFINR